MIVKGDLEAIPEISKSSDVLTIEHRNVQWL
jgi:hypothetical protein